MLKRRRFGGRDVRDEKTLTSHQNCCSQHKRHENHDPHRGAVGFPSSARQDLNKAGRIAIDVVARVEQKHLFRVLNPRFQYRWGN